MYIIGHDREGWRGEKKGEGREKWQIKSFKSPTKSEEMWTLNYIPLKSSEFLPIGYLSSASWQKAVWMWK